MLGASSKRRAVMIEASNFIHNDKGAYFSQNADFADSKVVELTDGTVGKAA
jgi:hypothetical protein